MAGGRGVRRHADAGHRRAWWTCWRCRRRAGAEICARCGRRVGGAGGGDPDRLVVVPGHRRCRAAAPSWPGPTAWCCTPPATRCAAPPSRGARRLGALAGARPRACGYRLAPADLIFPPRRTQWRSGGSTTTHTRAPSGPPVWSRWACGPRGDRSTRLARLRSRCRGSSRRAAGLGKPAVRRPGGHRRALGPAHARPHHERGRGRWNTTDPGQNHLQTTPSGAGAVLVRWGQHRGPAALPPGRVECPRQPEVRPRPGRPPRGRAPRRMNGRTPCVRSGRHYGFVAISRTPRSDAPSDGAPIETTARRGE